MLTNSVCAIKKTPHFTITKMNWLMLSKDLITVYSENHTKHINTEWRVTDCWSRWDMYCLLLRRKALTFIVWADTVEGTYRPCEKCKALTLFIPKACTLVQNIRLYINEQTWACTKRAVTSYAPALPTSVLCGLSFMSYKLSRRVILK
jgi:hypothetical protein